MVAAHSAPTLHEQTSCPRHLVCDILRVNKHWAKIAWRMLWCCHGGRQWRGGSRQVHWYCGQDVLTHGYSPCPLSSIYWERTRARCNACL